MAMERQAAALAAFRRGVAAGRGDVTLLWRSNTCTRAEFDEAAREAKAASVRRYAEQQRRMREDAWADRGAAGRG
ncbi:hypothetical protein NQ498_01695 [Collinsella stercoris]|nr:hypothetical protein [Collinsella stercoris]UEA45502.1 hypothetical protein LK434_10335 [Collinsella stercoris DSM 13279]UWP11974.1 hypothetical protein NQ498_01695 [Collinsella stercoris]